jgi:hypothetical protein
MHARTERTLFIILTGLIAGILIQWTFSKYGGIPGFISLVVLLVMTGAIVWTIRRYRGRHRITR